jgi:hypothetical protein
MRYLYLTLLLAVAGSCKKNGHDPEIVIKYVADIKAERYEDIELPAFNVNHIDALLRHASDGQVVTRYPVPLYSSFWAGPVETGIVLLYAIEAIRTQHDWPALGVKVVDRQNMERDVLLAEVLPLYRAWWKANKGKNPEALKAANPLEGSGLAWSYCLHRCAGLSRIDIGAGRSRL